MTAPTEKRWTVAVKLKRKAKTWNIYVNGPATKAEAEAAARNSFGPDAVKVDTCNAVECTDAVEPNHNTDT